MRSVLITLAVVSFVFALALCSFIYGAKYGSQKAIEGTKKWWREKGRNTHNPHYRVTP